MAFTDDDCRPEPGWLEAGLRAHRTSPGSIVQGRTRPEPADEPILDRPHSRSIRVDSLGPFFQTCNVFYPRELLERVGGFDERIPTPSSEDADLALRALASGAGAVFAEDALVNHEVVVRSLAEAVRFSTRWRTLPALVSRHPEIRPAFTWHGWVWRETHARLLTAISGTLCARILIPTGHTTRCISAPEAIFSSRKCSKIVRALRELPIMPRNKNGLWIQSLSTRASCRWPRVTINAKLGTARSGKASSLSQTSACKAISRGK